MEYFLPKKISVNTIYDEILPYLSNEYLKIKTNDSIIISFIYTEIIDANAIPLVMCILNVLKNYHKRPIRLELYYNPRLLYFLEKINFFLCATELEFIDYNKDLIGGFDDLKKYNDKHKLHIYYPVLEYYTYSFQEKMKIRNHLSEKLRYEVYSDYISIITQKCFFSDEDIDILRNALTEITMNAQLYSQTMSYVYLQSGIKVAQGVQKTLLSVADVGIGFAESLDRKREKRGLCDGSEGYCYEDQEAFDRRVSELGIDKEKYADFLAIMEALYYSQMQSREMNLYTLKVMLARNNAVFKIHNNNTQVIFSYRRCKMCTNKEILNCIKCLYCDSKGTVSSYSPIKWHRAPLAGVHIDVEFITEVL